MREYKKRIAKVEMELKNDLYPAEVSFLSKFGRAILELRRERGAEVEKTTLAYLNEVEAELKAVEKKYEETLENMMERTLNYMRSRKRREFKEDVNRYMAAREGLFKNMGSWDREKYTRIMGELSVMTNTLLEVLTEHQNSLKVEMLKSPEDLVKEATRAAQKSLFRTTFVTPMRVTESEPMPKLLPAG